MKFFRLLIGFPRGLVLGLGSLGPVMLALAMSNSVVLKTWVAVEAQCAALGVWVFLVIREMLKSTPQRERSPYFKATTKSVDTEILQAGYITLYVDREGVRRCPHCHHSIESADNIQEWEKNAP